MPSDTTEKIKVCATISFHHEHGIFLSYELIAQLGVKKGDPVTIGRHNFFLFETCKNLSEVSPTEEAKAILAAFEDLVAYHYSFLGSYGITERLSLKTMFPFIFNLKGICPDLEVRNDTIFTWIYRNIEDVLIKLDEMAYEIKIPKSVEQELNSSIDGLAKLLRSFYNGANCVMGAAPYLSLNPRNIETAFGLSEIELGYASKFGYDKTLAINPYILYWLISELGSFKQNKLHWNYHDYEISSGRERPRVPINKLIIKTYIPTCELLSIGATQEWTRNYLCQELLNQKQFVLPQDLLLPISCPSIVLKEEYEEEKATTYIEVTPYGPVPYGVVDIPQFTKDTEVYIKFFDFPLFNKKRPIVIDTSALDIARFPYDVKSPFYQAFLAGRLIIIPNIVLYEAKTRYSTKDRERVAKALTRLNQMRGWGFIDDVVQKGQLPEDMRTTRGKMRKKQLEDLFDVIILNTAIENNAILFTNDRELAEFAFLRGVYSISYIGLEDDIRSVIRGHDLEYDKETIVEAVQKYARYN